MLTVKDFTKGDIAYVLHRRGGRFLISTISEHKVSTVGRKYVTLDNNTKYEECDDNYLCEVVSYGWNSLLFRTRQAAEEYVETEDLRLWLSRINMFTANHYTLEQLKKVKEILEPDEEKVHPTE